MIVMCMLVNSENMSLNWSATDFFLPFFFFFGAHLDIYGLIICPVIESAVDGEVLHTV